MRKGIKIFLSLVSSVILIAIMIPVAGSILLSSYSVQNYVVGKIAGRLSEKLGTTVSLDRVGIRLFNRVTLDGLYVEDLQGDTLLYVSRLDAGFRGYNPWTGKFRLGEVRIGGADFRIEQDSTLTTNLKYITQKLSRENPSEDPKPLVMSAVAVKVDSSRFRLRRFAVPEREGAINFADMDIRDISLDIERISLTDDSIGARIKNISAREKSGFELLSFSGGDVRVWSRGIHIRDLRVKDPQSEIFMSELHFDYPGWRSFGRFTKEVRLHALPKGSRVAFRTIGWFAPGLKQWESVFRIDGAIDGTVSALSGRLDRVETGLGTRLAARFSIDGLPDIDDTRFAVDIQELSTRAGDAETILKDISGQEFGGASRWVSGLGNVGLTGRFDGLLTDFTVEGKLRSVPGNADFDLRLKPAERGRTHLDGRVRLDEFALGDFLSVKEMGGTTLSAHLNGFIGGDSLRLLVDGEVARLHYAGYDYRDIDIDGEISNKYYKGFVGSSDPNVDFGLEGTFDFNGAIPEYDFALALNRLDLNKLGLNRRDSVSILSAGMRIKAQGTTLDDITGNGSITNLTYVFPGDTLRSSEILLLGDNLSERKRIRLESDFLDAELTSRLNVVDIVPYLRATARYYLPSLDSAGTELPGHLIRQLDSTRRTSADNYYAFRMQVKESGQFASALLPGLYVEPGTNLSFLFNPAERNFSLVVNSELIEFNNLYIAKLNLTNRNQADSIALYLRTDEVGIGNFFMPELTLHGGIRDNLIHLSAGFTNRQNGLSAMINTVSQLRADTAGRSTDWHTRFTASRIRINEQEWRITSPEVVWGGGKVVGIDRFRILTAGQSLLLDGRLSADPRDTLHLSMNNFDLSPLSGLMDRYGYRMSGRMNGQADLIAGKGEALFYGRIGFEDLRFNDRPVQNSVFTSEWDPRNEQIRMSLVLESRDTVMRGGYRPADKHYNIEAHIPDIDLSLLSPVLKGALTDIEGSAQAHVQLRGAGGKPSLNGTIKVPSFAGTVDFTRARYHLREAEIKVADNCLILPRSTLYDEEGNQGSVEFNLRTRYFSQMSYDLRIVPRRMLGLNTTVQDNDYFYGKAYASGTVSIRGDRRGVNMEMNVTAENHSQLFLPLTGASSIAEADFILFETPGQRKTTPSSRYEEIRMLRERRRSNQPLSDTDIRMQIHVRPDTRVQLVIDPKIGDIIRGNGNGSIDLRIRPREGVFSMVGEYRISEGSYLFTLMNILNKRFTIEPGSSILWTGDPLNALLNVTANYRVRASAGPLTGINQVIPVDCKILLSDRLSQPTINFDITLPTTDAETRSALQNTMNTQEQKSQQFVWLLMTNGFYTDTGQGGASNIGTATTAVTGFDFLSNQISNMFSSQRFSFNFGYTPRGDFSSDEFEGAFSSELIPNKLILEGEVNYNLDNNEADPRTNQLSGDFSLTYIIDRQGNLRTKVFSRTINRFDENQGLQETGLGLYYRRDFDRWRDLFRRWRNRPRPSSEPGEKADSLP